jgi:uncharacterized protein
MIKQILICLCLSCSVALAADPTATPSNVESSPPSEASIRELLELGKVQKMLDSVAAKVDGLVKRAMEQAIEGKPVSEKVRQQIDKFETELMTAFKEEFTWEKMEPFYMRIYQKSLTQQEVDGMIAFYKTPAGEAVINKLPAILQNTMAEMQDMMRPMMQRVERMQQDIIAEVKADEAKTDEGKTGKAKKGKKG